jgi:rod shape-determining protein MreD
MSTSDVASSGRIARPARAVGRGLGAVTLLGIGAVLLQVSFVPYIRIADGIPDLVACVVVAVALLRGRLVGAVTGFACGLLVELAAPVGTLGVLALLYLAVGWWCGRYAERSEPPPLAVQIGLIVVAAAVVQAGYAIVQVLLGSDVPGAFTVSHVILPCMFLTALLAAPVLLVARRLLGAPRALEPFQVPR